MTLAARLTATIDRVNTVLAQNWLLPCQVEAIGITGEQRIAEVFVRFEDGALHSTFISTAAFNPYTVLDAVHRAHLLQWLQIPVAEANDRDALEVIAYASGAAPKPAQTHRDQTHSGPGTAQ